MLLLSCSLLTSRNHPGLLASAWCCAQLHRLTVLLPQQRLRPQAGRGPSHMPAAAHLGAGQQQHDTPSWLACTQSGTSTGTIINMIVCHCLYITCACNSCTYTYGHKQQPVPQGTALHQQRQPVHLSVLSAARALTVAGVTLGVDISALNPHAQAALTVRPAPAHSNRHQTGLSEVSNLGHKSHVSLT